MNNLLGNCVNYFEQEYDNTFVYSEDEDRGNPMVAGFQDELDSEDEMEASRCSQQGTSKSKITQDIDLSSEEEEITTLSRTQVVKYNEDYVTSDDDNAVVDNVTIKSAKKSTSDVSDIETKSKSNSLSSGSDKDMTVKSGSNIRVNSINISSANSLTGSVSSNAASESEKLTQNGLSNNLQSNISSVRKISSDSSRSDHMTHSGNQKAQEKLSNEDSDSESDGNQVTVLQDVDINPEDFGGADVFNDWLNKQEVSRGIPQFL